MAASKRHRRGFAHEPAGGSVEWYTPPLVFAALGLAFDLDPCSPGAAVVPWIPARSHYTRREDGLMHPWHGRVWLNPPYGRGIERWLERFAAHRHGIALIFARTDTGWFHRYATRADALCFTRGRIPFVSPKESGPQQHASAGCGSVFLAYGRECVAALRRSGLGWVVEPDGTRDPGRAAGAIVGARHTARRAA